MNTPHTADLQPVLDRLDTMCDAGFGIALHLRFARPTFLYSTYPTVWRDLYSETGLMLHDPVVRWGLTNTGRIRWNDIPFADPENVMGRAADFGLTHGIACAVGPAESRSFAGFCRSASAFSEEDSETAHNLLQMLHDLTMPR